MEKLFPVGTVLVWKGTKKDAFVKIDSDAWGSWRTLERQHDLPLDKRYGWKWPDQDVKKYYSDIMTFRLPA